MAYSAPDSELGGAPAFAAEKCSCTALILPQKSRMRKRTRWFFRGTASCMGPPGIEESMVKEESALEELRVVVDSLVRRIEVLEMSSLHRMKLEDDDDLLHGQSLCEVAADLRSRIEILEAASLFSSKPKAGDILDQGPHLHEPSGDLFTRSLPICEDMQIRLLSPPPPTAEAFVPGQVVHERRREYPSGDSEQSHRKQEWHPHQNCGGESGSSQVDTMYSPSADDAVEPDGTHFRSAFIDAPPHSHCCRPLDFLELSDVLNLAVTCCTVFEHQLIGSFFLRYFDRNNCPSEYENDCCDFYDLRTRD
eukprot:TRINITY_DN69362_c0_g1_i1.p1 TRINITY_DN69362_c0_g1~~TRINITY_DN69362_c0_g1_i1.p1  ORF type:complete len:307 (+),score=44.70 TRINITY_DN69362_c0_g1_i1:111-1031(+)